MTYQTNVNVALNKWRWSESMFINLFSGTLSKQPRKIEFITVYSPLGMSKFKISFPQIWPSLKSRDCERVHADTQAQKPSYKLEPICHQASIEPNVLRTSQQFVLTLNFSTLSNICLRFGPFWTRSELSERLRRRKIVGLLLTFAVRS